MPTAKEQWRDLGVYYDLGDHWHFYGARKGIERFARHLREYAENPANAQLSEHEHYGPYMYLEIMTRDSAVIKREYIAGTLEDLKNLSETILGKLAEMSPGETFSVDKEYGKENEVTAKFFVMGNDFDPASMDKYEGDSIY